jgi:hypothetical protein
VARLVGFSAALGDSFDSKLRRRSTQWSKGTSARPGVLTGKVVVREKLGGNDILDAPERCRDILRGGHRWWSNEEQWSVMLHLLYGDISGKAVLTSGCYLCREAEWMDAIAAWITALKEAGVESFHATDFFSARGLFDDDRWRKRADDGRMIPGGPLHDAFAARFSNIPRIAGLVGFAFSLDVPSFRDLVVPEMLKEERVHQLTNERTYVIMNNIARASAFLEREGYRENGRIQIMFEDEAGAEKYIKFFRESRERGERWTYFYQSFNLGPKAFPPLEMADLAAHEGWRRTKEMWSHTPRALRKSFEAMIGTGQFELQAHGMREAAINAVQIRDLATMFPDGLIPPEYLRMV